jgi:hypothetical protein
VLARALCHHKDVQNAFDDGILWVTLGQNPGDLTGRVEDLIYLLSGQRPGFAGIEAATALLVDLLVDRDILMVVDDVWDANHLRPFVQGGSRCAQVITTRVIDTVPSVPAASTSMPCGRRRHSRSSATGWLMGFTQGCAISRCASASGRCC